MIAESQSYRTIALLIAGNNQRLVYSGQINTVISRSNSWVSTFAAKLLMAAKADVNVKVEYNGKMHTALSVAKQNGHTQIEMLLRKYGAKE